MTEVSDDRYDRRPILLIESAGGSNLGNCYNAHCYRVQSNRELDNAAFAGLRAAGMIGYGQSWNVSAPERLEMRYVPNGKDWAGRPYCMVCMPYWVYYVTDRVDSSG